MAARHLVELIRRLHPDTSVRQLEANAGLSPHSLAYFLKPSTTMKRLPPASTIDDIARALGCDPVEVVRAFAADLDLPWNDPPLSHEDREFLRLLQRLDVKERTTLHLVAQSMVQASEQSSGAS